MLLNERSINLHSNFVYRISSWSHWHCRRWPQYKIEYFTVQFAQRIRGRNVNFSLFNFHFVAFEPTQQHMLLLEVVVVIVKCTYGWLAQHSSIEKNAGKRNVLHFWCLPKTCSSSTQKKMQMNYFANGILLTRSPDCWSRVEKVGESLVMRGRK